MTRGLVTLVLLLINLVRWGTPIILSGFVKLVAPARHRARIVRWISERLVEKWVEGNNRILDRMLSTQWDVEVVGDVGREGRALLISNHISWADIIVLLRLFHGRAPLVRFFIKQELIWFPIVGQCAWILDFPFMKRYTREYLAKHPEKRGRDLETTRVACRRFSQIPVLIANFVEGTRFSEEKRIAQASPYRYLLRPRVGGVAFVMASLGEQLDATFDVTIAYPDTPMSLWRLITNRIPRIVVRARAMPVPPAFFDEAVTRPGPEREAFKRWIEDLWKDKDALLEQIRSGR